MSRPWRESRAWIMSAPSTLSSVESSRALFWRGIRMESLTRRRLERATTRREMIVSRCATDAHREQRRRSECAAPNALFPARRPRTRYVSGERHPPCVCPERPSSERDEVKGRLVRRFFSRLTRSRRHYHHELRFLLEGCEGMVRPDWRQRSRASEEDRGSEAAECDGGFDAGSSVQRHQQQGRVRGYNLSGDY